MNGRTVDKGYVVKVLSTNTYLADTLSNGMIKVVLFPNKYEAQVMEHNFHKDRNNGLIQTQVVPVKIVEVR